MCQTLVTLHTYIYTDAERITPAYHTTLCPTNENSAVYTPSYA